MSNEALIGRLEGVIKSYRDLRANSAPGVHERLLQDCLDALRSERKPLSDLIPTNWLDPLLTGPGAALPTMGTIGPQHVEALLRGIKKRIEEAENVAVR